ncbi:MAG TPA: D-arabinono-1,4-lactone oxidase [Caulobacteraceae bacterium]
MATWRNWSGSVVASPARLATPVTETELVALVAGAQQVRVAGAGHSFMPLCETDGLLISLANMEGRAEIAPDRRTVRAPAGMSIRHLTAALWEAGLSLANQGDIDKQAVGGALATATHGTGRTLGCLSTFAVGYRLILADGTAVECDAMHDPDLFEAQRVSLGMLGVTTQVKLGVVPAFFLQERVSRAPLDEILSQWEALADHHRHVEFFVLPYTDEIMLKVLALTDRGDDPPPSEHAGIFQAVCDLARLAPGLAPSLQRLMARSIGGSLRVAPAWRIFPSERITRFEEMEYEIPAAAGPGALRSAIALIRRRRAPIVFPLEFRTVAADDLWLSPMNGRECVSISLHQYAKMAWREIFAEVEVVFRAAGGRPHWAKRHGLTSSDVLELYPLAPRWGEVRRRVDPTAKFMNAHLRELFAFSL